MNLLNFSNLDDFLKIDLGCLLNRLTSGTMFLKGGNLVPLLSPSAVINLSMRRIHILGASGSGVSTLGLQLGQRLNLPTFDCDAYYWEKTDPPFVKATLIPERQKKLLDDLKPYDSWICSGSMDSWSEPFEGFFTHIVFLYVPREIRIQRLRERESRLWGSRILVGGDMYNEHEKFISWAEQYDEGIRSGRSLSRHNAWLARQNAPILKMEGVLSSKDILQRVLLFVE